MRPPLQSNYPWIWGSFNATCVFLDTHLVINLSSCFVMQCDYWPKGSFFKVSRQVSSRGLWYHILAKVCYFIYRLELKRCQSSLRWRSYWWSINSSWYWPPPLHDGFIQAEVKDSDAYWRHANLVGSPFCEWQCPHSPLFSWRDSVKLPTFYYLWEGVLLR